MRLGMPRDFDELVQQHGATISRVAGAHDLLLIAHHLCYRGVIRRFRPAREISRDQVVAYLGLPLSSWLITSRTRPHVLPKPIQGTRRDPTSTYLFSDAERCYAVRTRVFPQFRRLGFGRTVVPGFDEYLEVESKKLVEELEFGYIFDVPPDLPQSDTEMHKAYAHMVAKVVRYRLKFGMDVEDAIDEIWCKLLRSNLLVKFMRSAHKRLPAQMTAEQALDYLGVEWCAWRRMMACHDKPPNPVKGDAASPEAIYRSEDILALDVSGYFKKRGLRFLPPSSVSRELFDKYVATAAEHALKNLFRTLDRRFNREETLHEGAAIHENRRVRRREDADFSWEETLSNSGTLPLSGSGINSIAPDALVDIARRARASQLMQGL